jgi:hypothetical protein
MDMETRMPYYLSTQAALQAGPIQHPLKWSRQSSMTTPTSEWWCNFNPFRKRAAPDTRFADLYDLPVTNLRKAFPYPFKHMFLTRMFQHIAS